MKYQYFSAVDFFNKINCEQMAVELVWKYKIDDSEYFCPKCGRKEYYQHRNRPEIRECKHCRFQHRLRVGTIFENSKMPMLTWTRAIYFMMMGKRGISALELQRQLKIGCYQTALLMLRRIRKALFDRDEQYKLKGIIEFDGGFIGRKEHNNQTPVLLAVETKSWIDDRGRERKNAGFAKVALLKETHNNAQDFINENIETLSELHTDGFSAYRAKFNGVDVKSVATYNDRKILASWLPWVHRFMCNAKAWIEGTHHGVESQHLKLYLAEFTYRFNRRHDYKRYFSRALFACAISSKDYAMPIELPMAA